MRQVLQTRNGGTVVRDVPQPACEPGSVLVENAFSVISSGTERSRVALSEKSLFDKARERPDLVHQMIDKARREGIRSTAKTVRSRLGDETPVGYSSSGTVIEVGARVSGIQPGDRVACGGAGHANHAEVVCVPSNLCARLPDGVSLEYASFTTIAAIALHGVRLAEAAIGERVAVIGCGLVGRMACKLLRAAGCDVFAFDVDPERLEFTRRDADGVALVVEAAQIIDRATNGVGVDASLVTASAATPEPLALGAELCRDRGSLVLVGAVPIELPRTPLYNKELRFRVSRSYGPGRYDPEYEERGLDYPMGYVRWTEGRNMASTLALMAAGRLDVGDLIDAVLPVERASEAYRRLTDREGDQPRGALLFSYDGPVDRELEVTPNPIATVNATVANTATTQKRALGRVPRLSLVGPGSFATGVLVPEFSFAGAQLELVGGGSGPSAEAAVRRLGFARAAGSPDEIVADACTDAIAICTRHESHASLVVAGLDAGKHIFCEKPLALTRAELDAAIKAEARSEGVLTVGFNRRFSPQLWEAREFLEGRGPLTLAYRVSAGILPPDHWVHDVECGGGRLLGECCHFVDCVRYLFGVPIVAVHAVAHGDPALPRQVHDNLVITLTAADRSIGTIIYAASGASAVRKERLEAFAGSRTAILDDYRVLDLFDNAKRRRSRRRTQDKGHAAEVRAFVDGCRRGVGTIPVEEIENVTLATIAAVESLRSGETVRVEGHSPS